MDMKNIEVGLADILELNGALVASLFDWQSGMVWVWLVVLTLTLSLHQQVTQMS